MKTRSRIAAVVLFIVLLGGLVWLLSRSGSQEPVYAGKPLSYWLKAMDYSPSGQTGASHRDASRAVRHAGTNGIPLYLRMLQATDSQIKIQLMALAQKQHLVRFRFRTAESLRREAVSAFLILGVRAKAAVPDLIRLYKETSLADSRAGIAQVLGNIGPGAKEALPLLQSEATSTNASLQSAAKNALQNINRTQASVLIDRESSTLNGLRDFDTRRQADSARTLCGELFWIGNRASSAVPVLLDLLKQQRTNSYWIRFALEQLDPDAAANAQANGSAPAEDRIARTAAPGESNDFDPASGDSARLFAVGDWSETVADQRHRLQGRFLVYESPASRQAPQPGRNVAVFLELQEVTGAINLVPATICVDHRDDFECELRDAQGNPALLGPVSEHSTAAPTWIVVPFDGSVRFRVDSFRFDPDGKAGDPIVQLGSRAWRIPAGDTNNYLLSATFSPSTNHVDPLDYDVWGATLKLPPVRISASKLKLEPN